MFVIDGLQQQLAAYISWVNSQLKRKPGLKPITDLRHDLQDGVVLTQLIEIVGKCTYKHIYTHKWLTRCSNTGGRIRRMVSEVLNMFISLFMGAYIVRTFRIFH